MTDGAYSGSRAGGDVRGLMISCERGATQWQLERGLWRLAEVEMNRKRVLDKTAGLDVCAVMLRMRV